MNKRELIDAVSGRVGEATPRRTVEDVLDAFTQTVTDTLRSGEDVTLTGFGKFEPRERAARTGLNPQTGEAIAIRATTVPAFRPGQALKDAVAGGRRPAAKKAGGKKAATKKAATKKAAKKAVTKKTATTKKAATKKTATKKAARKR